MSTSPSATDSQIISVSRLIPAPASEIFDLLADASRHSEIDGSNTVQGAKSEGPVPLTLGTRFGMEMKVKFLPYKITNEVVEFEQDRLIAWQHFGGHRWRYELEPDVASGGSSTLVTESFDFSVAVVPAAYKFLPQVKTHAESMKLTLDRMEQLFRANN